MGKLDIYSLNPAIICQNEYLFLAESLGRIFVSQLLLQLIGYIANGRGLSLGFQVSGKNDLRGKLKERLAMLQDRA